MSAIVKATNDFVFGQIPAKVELEEICDPTLLRAIIEEWTLVPDFPKFVEFIGHERLWVCRGYGPSPANGGRFVMYEALVTYDAMVAVIPILRADGFILRAPEQIMRDVGG